MKYVQIIFLCFLYFQASGQNEDINDFSESEKVKFRQLMNINYHIQGRIFEHYPWIQRFIDMVTFEIKPELCSDTSKRNIKRYARL